MGNARALGLTAVMLFAVGCGDADDIPVPSGGPLLPAPPSGQGVQITTADFPVDPGTEVQDCYFYKVSDLLEMGGIAADQALNLHRTQIAYHPGSHHMNIFRVRTIIHHDDPSLDLDPANGDIQRSLNGGSPCSKSANWADWPLIANSQLDGQFDWEYPDGVANPLQPDETIMLQTHYVNATTQKTPGGGRVDVNLWVIPSSEVVHEMGTLFATKQSIRVCPSNPTPKFEGTCQFGGDKETRVIGANGHFHSRGRQFEMFGWDGKTVGTPPMENRFYLSEQWDHPPMARSPELEYVLPPNGGLWYTCSYQWSPPPPDVGCEKLDELDHTLFGTPEESLDCCYTFGNTVDRAEHCNVFMYYYPKADDVNCY